MAADRSKPGKSKKASAIRGFGEVDDAKVQAFGEQLGSMDLGALDDLEDPEELVTEIREPVRMPASEPKPVREDAVTASFEVVEEPEAKPNLEPVGEDAHPPQNRRMPTQPPAALTAAALELDLDEGPPGAESAPKAAPKPPASTPAKASPGVRTPPPKLTPRASPAPVRRGLFSVDRITNLLAGGAVGLLITVIPAKQIARRYEVREVEPMISDLEGAVDHPLGVEAGLVETPESIAARVEAGREKARRRYFAVWLLAGLPLGVGLGLAPRPGE